MSFAGVVVLGLLGGFVGLVVIGILSLAVLGSTVEPSYEPVAAFEDVARPVTVVEVTPETVAAELPLAASAATVFSVPTGNFSMRVDETWGKSMPGNFDGQETYLWMFGGADWWAQHRSALVAGFRGFSHDLHRRASDRGRVCRCRHLGTPEEVTTRSHAMHSIRQVG